MPEDVFRIVITAAVALACLAFVVQAGVAIGLYRVARDMQRKIGPMAEKGAAMAEKAGPVIDRIGPIMDKIGPVVEQVGPVLKKAGAEVDRATAILTTAQKILDDVRPQLAEISKDVAAVTRTGRQQVDRIAGLVGDASERARDRLEQIDQSVTSTVEQVEQAGDAMKRAVLRPVREVSGLAAGISAAVSTLVHGSGRSSVDHATQDEEMFI
jgi:methyl-accepting chemotaxis protein